MTSNLETLCGHVIDVRPYLDDHEAIQLQLLLNIATSLEEIKNELAGLRGLQISGSGRQQTANSTSYVFEVVDEGGRTERTNPGNKS